MYNKFTLLLTLFFVFQYSYSQRIFSENDKIVIENKLMRLTLNNDGTSKSLIHLATGEECLNTNIKLPICAITQYRPYDNENFLMFPAKPISFPSNKIKLEGNNLIVEFQDTYDIMTIKVDVKDEYIGFSLINRDYRLEDFGVKRKTEIDEFTLIQLPIKKRTNFGEWLNAIWDENVCINLAGTHPATKINSFKEKNHTTLYAGLEYKIGLFNIGAALIVSSKNDFFRCMDQLEQDYKMPRGVKSRQTPEYKYSYYELRNVTTKNIDEHIQYAKLGGFKTIVIYYTDFAISCGHFPFRSDYPNGMADLKEITDKIRAAGIIPGIHIHYSKVGRNDPYLTSKNPDTRFNHVRKFTLANKLSETDNIIYIEENPDGSCMENGRRLLQIGNELISYEKYTTVPPYQFQGCKRGDGNSTPKNYDKGTIFGLLDVDDWPLFIRVNQNTTIQEEIAERLGKIYEQAGFRFVYFDGAEDVHMPYWYNVSKSQLAVYNKMTPSPLFAEGAIKSHYGWHILSRGNAFDHFPPERIRQSMKKYTARCAEQVSKDFTSVNFGWIDYVAPDEKTIGMQPDMYEYICSKATAWNSPISLVGKLPAIRKHPRTQDNFNVIKLWEDAKNSNSITEEQKNQLKNLNKEFLLLKNAKGSYELYEYRQITSDTEKPIRAFIFKRNGKNCIVYWHMSGESSLTLNKEKKHFKLYNLKGKTIKIQTKEKQTIIPAKERLFLESDLNEEDFINIFRDAAGY